MPCLSKKYLGWVNTSSFVALMYVVCMYLDVDWVHDSFAGSSLTILWYQNDNLTRWTAIDSVILRDERVY